MRPGGAVLKRRPLPTVTLTSLRDADGCAGTAQVNLTGFYYDYSGLQLSRIVARTSVNDTIDAKIWGVELETVLSPSRNWLIKADRSTSGTSSAAATSDETIPVSLSGSITSWRSIA